MWSWLNVELCRKCYCPYDYDIMIWILQRHSRDWSMLGVSLVLTMSELLNKSSLDSISIWLFDQTIFCSVYVLYYGCISPLSFSEIRCKITLNHLLQLEIGEIAARGHFIMLASLLHAMYIKKVILMIPHMNFWWFSTQI